MIRETESTLHRQRAGSLEDRMIDQGSAEEMIRRIMDQPKSMRSEYTIMQGGTIYQSAEIETLAQQFGLGDVVEVTVDEVTSSGLPYFRKST